MSNSDLVSFVGFAAGMLFFLLGILGFFAFPVIRAYGKKGQALQIRKEKLDRAGIITNVVLAILYIPLSVVFGLSGMVGEGYINNSSPAQDVLIQVITIMGFYTPLMSLGSILSSVLLRRKGSSTRSFAMQFTALGYMVIVVILTALLDVI